MSKPAPETLEREKDKLYLTDAELIRRLGVPEKHTCGGSWQALRASMVFHVSSHFSAIDATGRR
jgi:hypothetical protein